MKSPFKVMSTAALAAAVAVPTLSVPAADAAESTSFQTVALETEDGSIVTVSFSAYAEAMTFGSGELGEFVESADVVAVSAEEGKFVSIRTLAMAKIENPDADTVSLLDELDESEDNLVSDEEVAEYTAWEDMGEDADPVVESVSANNLKVVTVNFNSELDSETVTASNIDVADKAYSLELSEDKMTVDIVFDSALEQSEDLDLTIDGVETVDGEAVAAWEETVTAADTEFPEISGVASLNAKQLEVYASEPIDFESDAYKVLNNIQIDGVAAIAKVVPNYDENKFVLEFASNQEPGTYEVELSALEDFAGYKADKGTFSYTVEEDDNAPEIVSAEARNKNEVLVTFDEAVSTQGSFEVDGTDAVATEVEGSNGTQYILSGFGSLDLGAIVEVEVSYEGQKDVVGNEVEDEETFSFEVSDDTTLPSVDANLKSGNKLVLNFSKSMQTDEGTINVLNEDGDEVTSTIDVDPSLFVEDTNNTQIELSASDLGLDSVDPADYTVVIEDMKDATVRGNLLPKQEIEVEAFDTNNPTVNDTYYVYDDEDSSDDDTITFYFSEAMDTESLQNLSNYVLNGGSALSAMSDVSVDSVSADGKSITINYPGAGELTTTDMFTVYSIKDEAGNLVVTNPDVELNTQTTLDETTFTASASSKDEVTVQFNTAIQSVDPSAIAIETAAGEPYALATNATISSTDPTKVTFTLNKDLGTNTSSYNVVENNVELITNIYGDNLDDDTTFTKSIADAISPEVSSVEVDSTNSNKFEIDFTENVTIDDPAVQYDLAVTDVTDGVQLDTTEYSVTEVSGDIVVTVEKDVVDHQFSVELTNGRYISDASGNDAVSFDAMTVLNADGDAAMITADVTAPSAPTIASTLEGDDVVSASEETDVTVSGTADAGSNVDVEITDGTNTVSSSLTADSNGDYTTDLDVSTLNEGSLTVSVTSSDDAGNTTSAVTKTITKDTEVTASIATPLESDDVVNSAEASDVTVSGTTEADANVDIVVTDSSSATLTDSVVADGSGNYTTDLDVSSLAEGSLDVAVTVTDSAGNTDTANATATLDTNAITATVDSTATNDANSFNTDFDEAASDVTITDQTNIAETVSTDFDASVDATTASFSVTNAGATTGESFTFTVTDEAGNVTTYLASFDGTSWTITVQ